MQTRPPPMKRTMRRIAKPAIGAVLLAQRTPELLSSMSGTQSCKDFTKLSHIKVANRR